MKQVLISVCRQVSVCAFIAAGLALPAQAQTSAATQERLPVEIFFKNAQIDKVQVSPNGKTIAMLATGKNDRKVLSIMDTSTLAPKIIAGYEKTDVVDFHWINSQRLVFQTGDTTAGLDEFRGGNGMFAVNIDGNQFRQLVGSTNGSNARVLTYSHRYLSPVNTENSNDIFITRNTGTRKNPSVSLMKLDTISGQTETITTPENAVGFMIDKNGQPRVASTRVDNLTGVAYKDEKTQQWRNLITYDNVKEDGFSPAFVSPDGQFYVTAHKGQDTTSVYRYDLEKNKIDDTPIVSTKGFDFNGNFIFSKKLNKLLGISFETDAVGVLWLDDKWKAIQEKIDKALPNTINGLSSATDVDSELVVVYSRSDIHPGSYLLYNVKTEQFTVIGDRKPEVDSKKMSYRTS